MRETTTLVDKYIQLCLYIENIQIKETGNIIYSISLSYTLHFSDLHTATSTSHPAINSE